MSTHFVHARRAPAWPGRVRSRHNPRVNSFSALEIQTPSEASELATLIARMAQGEAQAMAELYDATVSRVYSLVRRFAPDDASAQDVTQEVYLQAWQQAKRFDSTRGVAMAWLLNLARSRALDAWRKASSSPVLVNSEVADVAAGDLADARQPLDFLEATDNKAALHTAMQQLPAATRQMLSLAFFHDMSHAEISTHLSTPLGTVKSTVRRALLSLREHLQHIGLSAPQLAALNIEETP
jgi:RNA polymerase sigma factor (sigma-70 family)